MLEILKKIPLFNCIPETYCCAFFKKYYYYLLKDCNAIIEKRNCYLKKDKTISGCQNYSCLCRYSIKDEYLAVKKKDFNYIFILNEDFQEINKIELKISNIYKKEIKALTYNYKAQKIMLITADRLYSFSLDGDFLKEEININTLASVIQNNSQSRIVRNTNSCCNQYYNNCDLKFTSIGFVCGKVFVAYTKNKSAFISEISPNGNIVNTYYIDENIEIKSIFEVNKNMQLLITKTNSYSYIYITNYCCCYNKHLKNYCKVCFDKCESHDCDYHPDECDEEIKCEDIIESIAKIEKSLAHILNAEGEKIQKAVNLADNTNELIKINESVSKVIVNITLLEQLLIEKLELALKCCDKEDKENNK